MFGGVTLDNNTRPVVVLSSVGVNIIDFKKVIIILVLKLIGEYYYYFYYYVYTVYIFLDS